ncbi:MAG TPA: alpha/beta hydrolase [Steroidobacteraceae bacterium]|nr:alpha/beta hydrolase [Steroidobacteraceae bacterium]
MANHTNKWVRASTGLIFLVLLIAGMGAGHQFLAEREEADRFPAPGLLVDIVGRRLHVMCSGSGAPAVLIEASGLGTALQSAAVQRALATTQRVCSYDRAGLGWSDPSPYPATAKAMELDLEQLLARLHLPAPLILVASSAGGLPSELYAREHPDRVAGLVWVDALSADALDRVPEIHRLQRSACLARDAAWLGAIRLLDPLHLNTADEALAARNVALTYRRRTLEAVCSLTRSFDESAEQIRHAPDLKSSIPAIVLVHGEPRDIDPFASAADLAQLEPKWRAAQAQFAARFTGSKLQVVEHSGHLIVGERPDAVVSAVRDVQGLPATASSN